MAYLDTDRSLYEIELALAQRFEYLKNIVVYNVIGVSEDLNIGHECDCLVLSKSGYLTEIEIKRSYQDFLNDFKKKTRSRGPLINNFYYCVPEKILDKVYVRLDEEMEKDSTFIYTGVITYNEKMELEVHGCRRRHKVIGEDGKTEYAFTYFSPSLHGKKLYIEQKLALARLGCIKTIKEKRKNVAFQKTEVERPEQQESELVVEVSGDPLF